MAFYKDEYCVQCHECKKRCPLELQPTSRSKRDACGACGSLDLEHEGGEPFRLEALEVEEAEGASGP